MPILQPIVNLADLLYQRGVRDVVISPGSRSAPLTLAVARHPNLRCRVVADERSAGFVALGLVQASLLNGKPARPVAVICTSGSAVYNLAPAVSEAFFQELPLLLLTADRPHEWLHQRDGQTIEQTGIFGNHVKRSYDLPTDYVHPDSRWSIERMANEAATLCQLAPMGPVHLNVPLREPFYPDADELFAYEQPRLIETLPAKPTLATETWHQLLTDWDNATRRLIVVGHQPRDPALLAILHRISAELAVPVLGEITSNVADNGLFITTSDTIFGQNDRDRNEALRPDLLITIGGSMLSRNLKTFLRGPSLRQYPTRQHWHIQPSADRLPDPFQSLTHLIPMQPKSFLEKLFADLDYARFREGDDEPEPDEANYLAHWQTADQHARRRVVKALLLPTPTVSASLIEWQAVAEVLTKLPVGSMLHLANSMPVRYANLSGLLENQKINVFSNRGTSGIDGCLSSAVGLALSTDQLVTVLIGDVAFFYDRNALWQYPIPANLRIVLLNNAGGHIFRMIDGPNRQPELQTYFETEQPLTAERTAADAHIEYQQVKDYIALTAVLTQFFEPSKTAKLLEIKTDKEANHAHFQAYKADSSKS